jgi:hypothetical protein
LGSAIELKYAPVQEESGGMRASGALKHNRVLTYPEALALRSSRREQVSHALAYFRIGGVI